MKKLILFLSMFSCVFVINAQIYSNKMVLDKFDDIISNQQIKTLVQWITVDSIPVPVLSIQEKGKTPTLYVRFDNSEQHLGNEENLTTFASDIYGFQTSWLVIELNAFKKAIKTNSEEEKEYIRNNFVFKVVHRTISLTKFSFNYDTQLFWIQPAFKDDYRILYCMD